MDRLYQLGNELRPELDHVAWCHVDGLYQLGNELRPEHNIHQHRLSEDCIS